MHPFLLGLPLGFQRLLLLGQVGQLLLQLGEALLGGGVFLLFQSLALDLQLHDPAMNLIQLAGHRVDFGPQLRTRLVDEVNGFVRQKTVADVAMRQYGGGYEGRVLDRDPMMDLVALFESAQDRNGVFDRRLIDENGLKAALESRVFFDVLSVLVERRGPDAMKLAAGQHRLEQVAGVHGALGLAGPHYRVQFVDKENDLALRFLDLLEDRFQALLELPAILGAGNERAHVESDDALVFQAFRHVAADNALRQSFDDCRLAYTGLADQHRIVLRAAREDLDHPADLFVAANHRVQFALPGELGKVPAIAFEGLVRRFGIRGSDPLVAAHFLQRGH